MSFEEARHYMTDALRDPQRARAVIREVRETSGVFARFNHRERTILGGIYGDLVTWHF